MSDINPAEVRDIRSGRPFRSTVREYYRKGFLPFPLPAKEKHPPPTGVTGRKPSVLVTPEQLDNWVDDKEHEHANIGLKFGRVLVEDREDLPDGEYIVLGIDVDDYVDSEADGKIKTKTGGEQLRELEERLGKLPDTWISSARADGVSGIRFFLAPAGLEWKGKAADSIDVIQPNHRYAVVWPSWHPKGGQYLFTQPGQPPDGTLPTLYGYRAQPLPLRPGQAKGHGTHIKFEQEPTRIPDVHDLPGLPEKWIDELTRDRTAEQDVDLDMDISVSDLDAWVREMFAKGKPCKETKSRFQYWLQRMEDDPSSHDKVLAAHWQLSRMGLLEGHAGAYTAIKSFEKRWTQNALEAGKRGLSEAKNELFRSRSLAWRKIKREIDDAREQGVELAAKRCHCFDEDEPSGGIWDAQRDKSAGVDADADGTGPMGVPKPSGKGKDPSEYERNDDGNADHLLDLFGEDLRYIYNYVSWVHWDGKRWGLDKDGVTRRCWRRVRQRQAKYLEHLYRLAEDALEKAAGNVQDPEYAAAFKKADGWRKWVEQCGNNTRAKGALEAAQSWPGITMPAETFDGNIRLLAVGNGVLELNTDGVKFRQVAKQDYLLYNTNVDYVPLSEQMRAGGDSLAAVKMWSDFLHRFQPDPEMRRFLQKTMGYCLLGKNTEKLGIFLQGVAHTGKSTFLNAVDAALGDYAGSVEMTIFNTEKLNPALAAALPRRIITTTEAGSARFEADVFKRITGGDAMSAELKGANDIITRIPAFVPVIGTNGPPSIHNADEALNYRLMVIPFDVSMKGKDEDDPGAADRIMEMCQPAVLAWLAEGWAMYASEGLDRRKWPEAVKARTSSFNESLDPVAQFIAENLEKVEHGGKGEKEECFVLNTRVYEAYVVWAEEVERLSDHKVLPKSVFGRRMNAQGIKAEKATREGLAGKMFYFGVRLKREDYSGGEFKVKSAKKDA